MHAVSRWPPLQPRRLKIWFKCLLFHHFCFSSLAEHNTSVFSPMVQWALPVYRHRSSGHKQKYIAHLFTVILIRQDYCPNNFLAWVNVANPAGSSSCWHWIELICFVFAFLLFWTLIMEIMGYSVLQLTLQTSTSLRTERTFCCIIVAASMSVKSLL